MWFPALQFDTAISSQFTFKSIILVHLINVLQYNEPLIQFDLCVSHKVEELNTVPHNCFLLTKLTLT